MSDNSPRTTRPRNMMMRFLSIGSINQLELIVTMEDLLCGSRKYPSFIHHHHFIIYLKIHITVGLARG